MADKSSPSAKALADSPSELGEATYTSPPASLTDAGLHCSLMGSASSLDNYMLIVGLDKGTSRDTLLLGLINASYWIGVVAGALVSGWFSDIVGRRKTIVCAVILGFIVIPIFTALQDFAWALVLRILNGVVTGILDSATLTCANAKDTESTPTWRFPIALQLVMVIMTVCMVPWLPESPRWLVRAGFLVEVRDVLQALDATEPDFETTDQRAKVDETVAAIQQALQAETEFSASVNYFTMLTRQDKFSTARRSWTGFLIQFTAQLMLGGGLIAAYGIEIFQTGGWSANTSALLSGISMITAATSGLVGATIVANRLGRRHVLTFGAISASIVVALLGVCAQFVSKYSSTDPILAKKYSIAVVVLLRAWQLNYGLFWLWRGFTYPSEIFPAQSRAMGNSLNVIGFALGSFCCNMVGSYIFQALGYRAFYMICGFSVIIGSACWVFVKETRRKTLEDIDDLF
ncbi:hypothetical protein M426DRAFT_21318 [Hypoxylon sp. CI-4A]|nr:hypothetical protein M426DRAFT_21318 [Hypoxylon sp. CI-4A]